MYFRTLGLTLATLVTTSVSAQTFKIGDQGPKLGGKVTWLKGEPVKQYEKGHVYVLDFWATWCGPCIATIPELNELAHDYRDRGVTVIGVAIWPRDSMTPTDKFVAEQGDKMNYVIAQDIDDRAATAYMAAAQLVGIPTTMVIDGDGRLAWIGHPQMDLRSVLDNVLSPDYDIEPLLVREKAVAQGKQLIKQAEKFAKAEQWDDSFAVIDEIVALDHQEFGYLSMIKFQYLLGKFKRTDEAYSYGKTIINEIAKNNPVLLENMADFIVSGPGIERRDLEMAHQAAERAVELTDSREPAVLETLARVCFEMKDFKQAHAELSKAIALVDDARIKKEMEDRLVVYAAAMNGKKAG
jgi:thiol-disulfide isomerase/thioredoxin